MFCGSSPLATAVSRIRRGVVDGHVFRQYVNLLHKSLVALLSDLGIPKRRPVHAIRHAFASFALKSGWPVGQLAKWLGHADINTTYSTPSI